MVSAMMRLIRGSKARGFSDACLRAPPRASAWHTFENAFVVTRMTLATHELPATFGAIHLDVQASSDEAYRRLLARFVDLYATRLFNPHWGEQATARPDNQLQIRMVFQELTEGEAHSAWQPLIDFLKANRDD
jgi:hypothetical protein